ncbi:MAG: class I SAM-dependent methyltransferase, partial [Oscillospiraceae bacterium]|nr:class I SAM-dependent methyltransferase [Oscillospiraceae bacterium]
MKQAEFAIFVAILLFYRSIFFMLIHSRLLACVNLIQGNFLCDVGTDHALLPMYAIQKNIIQ